jgi:hypothetical protein
VNEPDEIREQGAGGRALIEQVSEAVKVARSLRYENPASFDDVTEDELETVIRGLKAVSYSCSEGARLLERVLRGRRGEGDPVTSPGRETVDVVVADLEDPVAELEVPPAPGADE